MNRLRGIAGRRPLGLREPAERFLYNALQDHDAHGRRAGRTFAAAQKLGGPPASRRRQPSGLFDLTPTDEQRC
jgi:hypothetical protein